MSNSTDFYNNLNNFSGYMNALGFGSAQSGQPGYANLFGGAASGYQNAIGNLLNPAVNYGAQQNYLTGASGTQGLAEGLSNPNGQYGQDTANARNYINALQPGYTPEEQSKIRYGAQAPIAASYGDASTQLKDTAARTGNQAGVAQNLKTMAREKGGAMANSAAQTEGSIADARRQDALSKAGLMPIPGQMGLQGTQAAGGLYGNLMQGGTSQYGANIGATSLMQGPMNSYLNALGMTTSALGNTLGLRSANAYKGSVTSGIGNFATLAGAVGGRG